MQTLGKLLQLAALTIPLLAILAQINERITLGQMLGFALVALILFYIGRMISPPAA